MKRLIKRMLMILQVLLKRDISRKIFFYHDIGKKYTPMGTPEVLFWQHMELLSNARSTTICFDDGFRGIWDVREKLREKGIRPTVFVAIRLVGQPGYLTWDEIRTLQNDYGFEFQCHTWSHQTLAGGMIDESPIEDRTEAWFWRELVESKAELERRLGRAVTALCFPAGLFSDDVVRRCRAAGYAKVYASYPGNATDAYVQPRNLVQDFSVFDLKLAAIYGGMMVFRNRLYAKHYYKA